MRVEDVPTRLHQLLADEGADRALTGPAAWAAFRRFAAEPIDGIPTGMDLDRLLFEAGPTRYGPGGEPAITVDFQRQYTLRDDAGEYAGMRYVLCSFAYERDALTGVPRVEFWGESGSGCVAWIAEVEASPWFGLLHAEPTHAEVSSGAI